MEVVRDEAVLRAVTRYAEYGDEGALRYLGRDDPFGRWGQRVEANRELVDELSEKLAQLDPAEREALREALSRS